MDALSRAMAGLEEFLDSLERLETMDPEEVALLPARLEAVVAEVVAGASHRDGERAVWAGRLDAARERLDRARVGLEARRSEVAARLTQETRRSRSLDYRLPPPPTRGLNRKA